MKKSILIVFVLVAFNSFAQIEINSSKRKVSIQNVWIVLDTITQFAGNVEQEDTVCYTFSKAPDALRRNNLEGSKGRLEIYDTWTGNGSEIGDTIFRFTKFMKVEVLRSFKMVRYQLRTGRAWIEVENTNDEIIEKVIKKKLQLGIANNNAVWEYPLVYNITNPVIDTTEIE